MTLLVLQHIACEPPAALEDESRDRGLDLTESSSTRERSRWLDHAVGVPGRAVG